MANVKIKIELTGEDIIELVAEKYKLKADKSFITITKYAGDAREPEYTLIVVEGEPE